MSGGQPLSNMYVYIMTMHVARRAAQQLSSTMQARAPRLFGIGIVYVILFFSRLVSLTGSAWGLWAERPCTCTGTAPRF
jgi:hypothetical protein